MCSREIFTKKCRQQQIFDSDLKGAWHYNHVTFTPIAKNFMLYCRLIYMLSILCVRLTITVKAGIPESFKVGWYPRKKTGSSHLKLEQLRENLRNETVRLLALSFLGIKVLNGFTTDTMIKILIHAKVGCFIHRIEQKGVISKCATTCNSRTISIWNFKKILRIIQTKQDLTF